MIINSEHLNLNEYTNIFLGVFLWDCAILLYYFKCKHEFKILSNYIYGTEVLKSYIFSYHSKSIKK